MKVGLSMACLMMASAGALAQTATPAPTKPGDDAPTKAMDAATPEMKAPGGTEGAHPPADAMDKAVPTMKSGDPSTNAAPEAGATETTPAGNPFTMEDARKHLMQMGYTNVSELMKDAQGKWVGSATKDGKTVPVAVDVKAGVTTK